jgi:SAM-dependent methyltransferase
MKASEPSFLHETVAAELAERLFAINRSFPTFLCHGAPELSQAVAKGAIASDVASGTMSTTLVFEEGALPLAPGSLDAYASLLSLHAVNDLPGALTQIRHSLKPDGFFIAALFGSRTLTELRTAFMQAESEILKGAAPRFAPLPDVREAGALLQRAGFALPVADADELVVHYTDPMRLFSDLRLMGETNILEERHRRFLRRDVLGRALECWVSGASSSAGVRATFEVVYLSGWAPHESQQKPLRPGSATTPLSRALEGIRHRRADRRALSLAPFGHGRHDFSIHDIGAAHEHVDGPYDGKKDQKTNHRVLDRDSGRGIDKKPFQESLHGIHQPPSGQTTT